MIFVFVFVYIVVVVFVDVAVHAGFMIVASMDSGSITKGYR